MRLVRRLWLPACCTVPLQPPVGACRIRTAQTAARSVKQPILKTPRRRRQSSIQHGERIGDRYAERLSDYYFDSTIGSCSYQDYQEGLPRPYRKIVSSRSCDVARDVATEIMNPETVHYERTTSSMIRLLV